MPDNSEKYMRQCLSLAEKALQAGDPPVGAVIVFGNTVIGRGIEAGKSTGDITNHAEILAIRDAIGQGHRDKLHQAQLYTTHEPCIMCSYAIRHHRIPEIIFGVSVPFVGGSSSSFDVLTTNQVPQWGTIPLIQSGVCAAECESLNEKFKANR